MLKTGLITGTVLFALIYIAFGDQITFLPKEMKTASFQARTSIVKFSTGLIPGWTQKNPNQRTEDAIDKEMQGQPANSN